MDELHRTTAYGPSGDPPAADEDWTGRTLDEFRILRLLGRGGMGQVYLAEQTSLRRKVAVKMLRPELAANKNALARFRAEAEAVARLSHGNIVQVYRIGEQDGVHFMALEYVEGRNLRDYLNRKGPPELAASLSVMKQVAMGLQRAHEAGFIHRDIKPENILITRKGEAKITDFGLMRCFSESASPINLTQTGVAMGTPLYMSPEQVQGKSVDLRTDIYSFGVTCFSMLTGSPPFRGNSAFDIAVQHVQNEPPALSALRPDLPPELCAMVRKMMAKDPDERYQSFKEVLRDLSRIRDSLASGTPMSALALPASTTLPGTIVTTNLSRKMVSPPPGSRQGTWLRRAAIAALLAGMFLSGVTVRLIRHKLSATETPSVAAAPDKQQPIMSKEENFILEAARQYSDPSTTDTRELKRGVEFQIDLASYYLKHRRVDDADQFFRDLRERKLKPMPRGPGGREPEHPYRALGRLGEALVAAHRDQPQALERLDKLVEVKPRPFVGSPTVQIAGFPAIFDYPELRRLIVEALNRLAIAMNVDKFEKYPDLDQLRKLPSRSGRFPTPSKS